MKNMKYGRESSIRMSRPLRAWSRGKHMELVVVCGLWLRVMGSEDIRSCAMWSHHFSSQAAQTQIEKNTWTSKHKHTVYFNPSELSIT